MAVKKWTRVTFQIQCRQDGIGTGSGGEVQHQEVAQGFTRNMAGIFCNGEDEDRNRSMGQRSYGDLTGEALIFDLMITLTLVLALYSGKAVMCPGCQGWL